MPIHKLILPAHALFFVCFGSLLLILVFGTLYQHTHQPKEVVAEESVQAPAGPGETSKQKGAQAY